MQAGLWIPRRTIPDGALANEFFRREGAHQREYLYSKGIRDKRLDKYLERKLAPTYGDGSLSSTTDGVSSIATGSKTVPSGAVVVSFIKWEDDNRTPTLSGWGVGSWTYPQIYSPAAAGPHIRVGVGASTGATGVLTASFGSNTSWTKIGAIWLNGCDTVTPVDTSGVNNSSGTTRSVSALTNSVADSVYVLGCADYGGGAHSAYSFGGTGGTEDLDDSDTLGVGHLIVTSGASRAGQCTGPNVDWSAIMVIIKGGSSSITGQLGATIPNFSLAMTGSVDISAQWAATFGGLSASRLTGTVALQAELNAQLPAWTAALTAGAPNLNAELNAQMNSFVTTFVSNLEVQANLSATIGAIQAALTSTAAIQAELNALIPLITAVLLEDTAMSGNLAAQMPAWVTQLTGAVAITGNLNASLGAFSAQLRESGSTGSYMSLLKRRVILLMSEDDEDV